ncbi:hypothetical protein HFP43_07225 [Streptomyces sp. SJ1-7]|nr:hypothetical protein [Streptomyces sp. SJ1-7]
MLLAQMVRKSGLNTAISVALTPWRKPRVVHHPGKILLDVALAVALGGAVWPTSACCWPSRMFGPVVSDPTVSRVIDRLAASGPKAHAAIRDARSRARGGSGSWPVRTVRPPTAR